jgi:hypothetical protein
MKGLHESIKESNSAVALHIRKISACIGEKNIFLGMLLHRKGKRTILNGKALRLSKSL